MIFCKECKKECDTVTVCDMCGEEAEGIDTDYGFCRYCKEHADFVEYSECCGAEVAFAAPDNIEEKNEN